MLVLAMFVGLQSALPSMTEVRSKIFEEARIEKSFSDTWLIVKDGSTVMKVSRTVDGDMYRLDYSDEKTLVSSTGFSGANAWGIIFPDKTYYNDELKIPPDEREVLAPAKEDGTLEATFVNGRDIRIVASPDFKTVRIDPATLDDRPVRLLKAEAVRPTGRLDLKMWLEPDRWTPVRIEVSGGKTGSPSVNMLYRRDSFTKAPTLAPDYFQFKSSLVGGFSKMDDAVR